MAIDREKIVATAMDLLSQGGIDALSMRALAARLEVQPSALYWHVANKDELVTLMAGRIYQSAFDTVSADLPWREWLSEYGHALRRSMLAIRDCAALCARATPQNDAEVALARLASPLVRAGFSREEALGYEASVISLALGWSVYEQSGTMHAYLAEVVGFDRGFALGLHAMVEGIPEPG